MRRHKTWIPPSKLLLPEDMIHCDTCGQEIPWDGTAPEEGLDCDECIRKRWEEVVDFERNEPDEL
jgi:hypothetical protein